MDLNPTVESTMRKMKAKKSRQVAKEEKEFNPVDKYLGSKKQYLQDEQGNIKKFQTITGTYMPIFDMTVEMEAHERRGKEKHNQDLFGDIYHEHDSKFVARKKKRAKSKSVFTRNTATRQEQVEDL